MRNSANIVSVSGGKDSAATLLLALNHGAPNLTAVFADTGHEHPITYEYLATLEHHTGVPIRRIKADFTRRIQKKREFIIKRWAADGVPEARVDQALALLNPTGNPFLDLCLWKGRFPSVKARFCTQELKAIPLQDEVLFPAARGHDLVFSWQGVRAAESRARAQLPMMDAGELPGLWNFRPILNWSADQVFDLHRKHGVPWNPLYEKGMGRVGCMPCIMANKGELAEIARRYPEEFERVAEWEALVSAVSKRGSTQFYDARIAVKLLDDDDIHYSTHGIMVTKEWATTTRGGRQQDALLAMEPPLCSSQYGLCE